MVAATITGGNVLIKNVIPKHLEPITSKLEKAGATIEEFDDSVRVYRTGDMEPLNIKTMPHPGFPTDMQPLMTVLLTLARGRPSSPRDLGKPFPLCGRADPHGREHPGGRARGRD